MSGKYNYLQTKLHPFILDRRHVVKSETPQTDTIHTIYSPNKTDRISVVKPFGERRKNIIKQQL